MKKIFAFLVFQSLSFSAPSYIPQVAVDNAWRPMQNNIYVGNPNIKYQFIGHLKNKGKFYFKSGIYKDTSDKYFVRLDDDKVFDFSKGDSAKKYVPDFDSLVGFELRNTARVWNSDSVSNNGFNNFKSDTVFFPAIVMGDKWIFQSVRGKISLFSDEPGGSSYSKMDLNHTGMVKYNDSLLKIELRKNKRAKELLDKAAIGKGTSILMAVGGVGLFLGGIMSSDKEVADDKGGTKHEFDASPLIVIGAVVALAAQIPYYITKDNFKKAIDAYNQ